MKKILLSIFGICVLGMVATLVFNLSQKEEPTEKKEPKAMQYEILDDNVEVSADVKTFLKESFETKGFHVKETDKEIFVVLGAGQKDTTGHGISLNGVKEAKKKITIEYEVIAPPKTAKVEKKKTYPHMTLRFAKTNKEIEGKITKLNEGDKK